MSAYTGFDHVGVIAPDFAPFVALAEHLGVPVGEPAAVQDAGVEILMFDFFGTRLEIIVPSGPESRAQAIVDSGRAGVHHFGFTTPDAAAALAGFRDAGFTLIDQEPRPGVYDSQIGFARVGPALVEVVQPAVVEASLTWQLRTYQLRPGMADAFLAFWRGEAVPLRERLGFTVGGGWLDEDANVFVWLVGHPAPDGWAATERAYYDSPLRDGMSDPREFVAEFETRLLRRVEER